jgi:hypothetical protein
LIILSVQIMMAVLTFIMVSFLPSPIFYFAALPIIFFTSLFSYKEIDKRIGIKQIISILLKRKKQND